MERKENDQENASSSSEVSDLSACVILLTSDLETIKCIKDLLKTRSPFFQKIFECVEVPELIQVVYLDYNSRIIVHIIEFLYFNHISFDAVRICLFIFKNVCLYLS